jgi:hypothetical protein
MVDMEVGADHGIDRLARIAGGRQIGEKAGLKLVPGRDAAVLFVVAETGVDDDAPARRFDDERVDAHLEAAALIGEIGLQPRDRQHRFGCRLRQDEAAAAGNFELDDLGDRNLADPPLHRPRPFA